MRGNLIQGFGFTGLNFEKNNFGKITVNNNSDNSDNSELLSDPSIFRSKYDRTVSVV